MQTMIDKAVLEGFVDELEKSASEIRNSVMGAAELGGVKIPGTEIGKKLTTMDSINPASARLGSWKAVSFPELKKMTRSKKTGLKFKARTIEPFRPEHKIKHLK